MKVSVSFAEKRKTVVMPEGARVIDVIGKMKINPETVIIRRGKDILLEEEAVRNNDSIEMIRIISGG